MLAVFQAVGPDAFLRGHAFGNAALLGHGGGLGLPVVVLGAGRAQGHGAGLVHIGGMPGGVDDAQVGALQRQGQAVEKGLDAGALQGVGGARELAVFGGVAGQAFLEVPAGAVLGVVAQQVDFVVAGDGAGVAAFDQALHQIDHARTVRSAVHEVADKHQGAGLGVAAAVVVAQVVQQVLQRRQLTVDVSHDVERAGGQGLDQAHGGKAFNEKNARWQLNGRSILLQCSKIVNPSSP